MRELYWYLSAVPELMSIVAERLRRLRQPRPGRRAMRAPQIGFAQLVQDFFLRRLVAQRGASARTVEAYRDAFELLLGFAEQRTGKPPSALALADLDAPLVLDFLDHLETERGNSVRTRNARLAAIHSFMRYAALRDPDLACRSPHACWPSRPNASTGPVLGYLSREQIAAILAAPDRTHLERSARRGPARHRLQHRRPRLRTHRPAGP